MTEKATNLTSENDKLALKEMDSKAKISLLETELDKLARKNAYRRVYCLASEFDFYTIIISGQNSVQLRSCNNVADKRS